MSGRSIEAPLAIELDEMRAPSDRERIQRTGPVPIEQSGVSGLPDQQGKDDAARHHRGENAPTRYPPEAQCRRRDDEPDQWSRNESQHWPSTMRPSHDQTLQPTIDRPAEAARHRARIRSGSLNG